MPVLHAPLAGFGLITVGLAGLMFDHWRHHDYPIGCEIAAEHVRLAQVQPARGRQQVVAASAAIGAGPRDNSRSADVIATAVRQALRAARFKGRRVVTCLPPTQLTYRPVRLAPMPESELPSAAHWKLAAELGLKSERMKSAVIPVGRVAEAGKARIEVVTVAAELGVLERHASLLTEAGLEPVAIDISCCAIARCVADATDAVDAAAVAILELDEAGVTLSACHGGNICFLRRLGSGLDRAFAIVASLLDVAPVQAKAMHRALQQAETSGTPSPLPLADLTADSARSTLGDAWQMYGRELAREVAMSLRYFCDTFGRSLATAGWLLAEPAVGAETLEVLQEQTGISFSPPDSVVQSRFIGTDMGRGGALVKALGLSLYEQELPSTRAAGEAA